MSRGLQSDPLAEGRGGGDAGLHRPFLAEEVAHLGATANGLIGYGARRSVLEPARARKEKRVCGFRSAPPYSPTSRQRFRAEARPV